MYNGRKTQPTIKPHRAKRGQKPVVSALRRTESENAFLQRTYRVGIPTIVGVLSLLLLLLAFDPRTLQFTFDEGIYLTGAIRVLEGAQPYKDFFSLTGPGVYWLYGALFALCGKSYLAAKMLLFAELSATTAITAALCWSCTRSLAITITLSGWLATFTASAQYRLYINHRWDSMFWSTVTVALVILSFRSNTASRWWASTAGCASVVAISLTPSVAPLCIAIMGFYCVSRATRKLAVFYAGGVSVSIGLIGAALLQTSSAADLLAAYRWTASHYSLANHVWFGFFHIQASAPSLLSGQYVSALILSLAPTTIVVVSLIILGIAQIKHQIVPDVVMLSGMVGAALIIATYPRMASNQLAFAMPLMLVAIGWQVSRMPVLGQRALSGCVATIALFLLLHVPSASGTKVVDTALGAVRCSIFDAAVLQNVKSHTMPGRNILVYPYLPLLYALTGSQPVTYFSYLQPGMMDALDEERVLEDCGRTPPSLIIWRRLSREQMETVWPNTDWANAGFPRLESYIQGRFHKVLVSKRLPVEFWMPNLLSQ